MRVSFALMSCLFASTISPLFAGCGDDGEDPDDGSMTGGQAGSGPTNTGGRVTTGGRGGGTGGGGGVSDGGEPATTGGTTGGTMQMPMGGSAGEAGDGGTGTGTGVGNSGGGGGKNACATNPCKNGGTCVNQANAAVCACAQGYKGELCEIDIDECLDNNGGCGASECVNLPGTFKCGDCEPGYARATSEGDCVDIDECTVLTQACDPRTDCTNTPGGYECSVCPSGLGGDPKNVCIDLDECLSDPCDPLSNCSNVFGSYFCSACPIGYDGDGTTCQDVNECMFNAGGCEVPLRDCINSIGSWKCGDCLEGYVENGPTQCDDIDECEEDDFDCEKGFGCHNLPGTYECLDIDECEVLETPCESGYECDNTEGDYDCVNIDECEEGTDECDDDLDICVDTDGGYDCDDVDECEEGLDNCEEGETCQNTDPGFECAPACEAPMAICDEECVSLDTDEHCGSCELQCEDGWFCHVGFGHCDPDD